ncbi:thiopeptide-type bacteriocin biosynthesis protein [Kineosporia sp. NBRC 101677]|uniref:thiopeptide-type bacteriocin biosynthesis protein n=1 Tax=Kineosporia sp. NBRC 101677 TaxID=3032197 RepID=UPI002556D17E|nr:thiopeptide-type bacteriocin biosynthesis protein [Kineosporia sp. NBRC 101677]
MNNYQDWQQANAWFTGREQAVRLATTQIGPLLADAEQQGLITSWFYIRKEQWRFRYLPTNAAAAATLAGRLSNLREPGWTWSVCEFERLAFGGDAGLEGALRLFHADSHHLLPWLATDRPMGQREICILLVSVLCRGAGLDWFEQGDVWERVAKLRPPVHSPQRLTELTDAMRTLMTIDAERISGPAQLPGTWVTAFEEAGRDLAELHHTGDLQRGLRTVLAQHVIFHANRAGITTLEQSLMANLAVRAVFHDQEETY